MQYLVVGPDGKEYGPATVELLKQWVVEGRLAPSSTLKDFASGQTVLASQVAELFPSGSAAASKGAPAPQDPMFAPDYQKPVPIVDPPEAATSGPTMSAAEEAQQRAAADKSAGIFAGGYTMPTNQAPASWSQPPSMPGISARQQAALAKSDGGELSWVAIRAVVAVVIFFAFRGSDVVYIVFRAIGLLVAVFAAVSAFQAHARGNRYGVAMIATTLVSALIVAIGWIIRIKTGGGV
jgi:hypothetical protein